MRRVCTIGEILVEIMRPEKNVSLGVPGTFLGPFPSGAPAIFIDAIARLGVQAGMVGSVGDDDFGRCVVNRLRSDGVDVRHIQVMPEKSTAVAFVTYLDSGERTFLFHIADAAAGQIRAKSLDDDFFEDVDVLHLNGSSLSINPEVRDACLTAIRLAKANDAIVTFDPNVRKELDDSGRNDIYESLLTYCDYILPSDGELEWITGASRFDEALKRVFSFGVKAVICKRGAGGSSVYTSDMELSYPAFTVDVIDPTGAGDCFSAGVVYGILQNWDWEKRLAFANAMGALATTKQGPMEGSESLAAVLSFLRDRECCQTQ